MANIDYSSFDFGSHKNSKGMITIGALGGFTIGIVLIVFDMLVKNNPQINGIGHKLGGDPSENKESEIGTCLVRIVIWPAFGAVSGVTGTLLW